MDANKLMELMRNKKATLKQKAKTIKPNPGSNRYVLLRSWRGEGQEFWHDFGQHYVKNAAGEIQSVYPCLKKTYDKPCPICEGLAAAIRSTTDDETVELLKGAASSQSYLFNVLALDSEEPNLPQILEVRKSVFSQLLDIAEEWGESMIDDETPQIITIIRDGKGLNTKYTVQISPKKHVVPKGALSKLNDLDEYVRQENEEQQRKALSAIHNVAGLLPAGSDKPRTASSAIGDDDDEALRAMESRREKAANKPDIALDDELDAMFGPTGTDD